MSQFAFAKVLANRGERLGLGIETVLSFGRKFFGTNGEKL